MNYKIVKVKPNTTKASNILRAAQKAKLYGGRLENYYKNPSQSKQDAWNDIVEFAIERNGRVDIVSANPFHFTALVDTPDAYYYFSPTICHELLKEKTYADMLHERNVTHDLNKRRT